MAPCASFLRARSRVCGGRSENDWKTFRDRWMARKNGILTQLNDLWLKPRRDQQARRRAARQRTQAPSRADRRWNSGSYPERSFFWQTRAERLDITLPGIRRTIGAEHPVIKTMNEIIGVFRNLGYSVEKGRRLKPLLQLRGAELPAEPSRARHAGHAVHRRTGIEAAARSSALAHAHFSGADSDDGKDEAAVRVCVRASCTATTHPTHALAHLPSSRRLAVDRNITFCDLKARSTTP